MWQLQNPNLDVNFIGANITSYALCSPYLNNTCGGSISTVCRYGNIDSVYGLSSHGFTWRDKIDVWSGPEEAFGISITAPKTAPCSFGINMQTEIIFVNVANNILTNRSIVSLSPCIIQLVWYTNYAFEPLLLSSTGALTTTSSTGALTTTSSTGALTTTSSTGALTTTSSTGALTSQPNTAVINDNSNNSKSSLGTILGSVIGSILSLVIIFCIMVCCIAAIGGGGLIFILIIFICLIGVILVIVFGAIMGTSLKLTLWKNNKSSAEVEISPKLFEFREVEFESLIIGEQIGHGSFGVVYKGIWQNAPVAIKRIKIDQFEGTLKMNEIIYEVKIMVQIGNHPNVVRIIGTSINNSNFFIITNYCKSGSLYDTLMYKDVNFTNDDLIKIAKEVASGLAFLHSNDILHRDVAARNVLLDSDGTAMISDFGLSRFIPNDAQNSYIYSDKSLGPIRWMAPESIKFNKFSIASDIWMYGVLLWEIWEKDIPFKGISTFQVANIIIEQGGPKPTNNTPSLIKNIMQRIFVFEPKNRISLTEIITIFNQPQVQDQDNINDGINTADYEFSSVDLFRTYSKSNEYIPGVNNETNNVNSVISNSNYE